MASWRASNSILEASGLNLGGSGNDFSRFSHAFGQPRSGSSGNPSSSSSSDCCQRLSKLMFQKKKTKMWRERAKPQSACISIRFRGSRRNVHSIRNFGMVWGGFWEHFGTVWEGLGRLMGSSYKLLCDVVGF